MTETKTTKTTAKSAKATTLVQALANFQKDLPTVLLDGDNPHFKSKFATLSNVTKEVFPKLAENGLAFSVGSFVDNGSLILDAHLIHESGESRSMQFPINETNPQKVGSAVTYYRRYALAALTGVVADTDDDGNAASAPAPEPLRKAQEKSAAKSASSKTNVQSPFRGKVTSEWIDSGKITREQAVELSNKVKDETGKSGDQMYEEVYRRLEAGEV